jgi:hypothetical protein
MNCADGSVVLRVELANPLFGQQPWFVRATAQLMMPWPDRQNPGMYTGPELSCDRKARFSKCHGVNAVGTGKAPAPVLTEPRP